MVDSSRLSLDAAGLVALADLTTVARRTALSGTSAFLDCLVLCPGLHRQQDSPKLNAGEYPICAAMTTGYVFRVENQATVAFLQQVGRAGQLTLVAVSPQPRHQSLVVRALRSFYDYEGASFFGTVCYAGCVGSTVATLGTLTLWKEWWTLTAVGTLIVARAINVLVLRRRAVEGWKGQPEAKVKSDLIVLLSQDRWVRIQGDVNDVKAVTSGEWLREPSLLENGFVALATLLVYLDAALAGYGSVEGKMLFLLLLFCTAGLLGLANECTGTLRMYDRTISVKGERRKHDRRLDLADDLIKDTGRKDWAIRLGMVKGRAVTEEDQVIREL